MQAPYLLLPVGLGVLLSYLFSHLLLWLRIISKKNHRKFWNIALLITFLVTGILGLLLAIQINYKLDWTAIKTILSWHVNFGIAMSLVAIFHFLWHLNYYLNLFKKPSKSKPGTAKSIRSGESVYRDNHLVFITGFSATIIQVLLLRELTTLFQGNEIMMTWTIGIWMVITGIGSYIGRSLQLKGKLNNSIPMLLLVIVLIPGIILVLLNLLKNAIFLPGVMISPLEYIILVIIILLPICLPTGLLFALFVRGNSSKEKNFIEIYLFESLGSILGGLVVSFLLINWFSVLQSVIIIGTIVSGIIFWRTRKITFIWVSVIMFITIALLLTFPFELKLRSKLFSGNKVIINKETYYGNITVTGSVNEYNFFLNGVLLFNTGNFIQSEEFVHYAMLQHQNPKNVLIVSGGVAGLTNEILKYPTVQHLDYLEINNQLISISEELNLLPKSPILKIYHTDINNYLKNTTRKYDIVIFALPDPTSVQLNRYYSNEFIKNLKSNLRSDAIIIYGLNSSGNYMSEWQNAKHSLVYNTLTANFRYIKIIPGEKDFFIASDTLLTNKISELCVKKGINNLYVNKDYIDDNSIERRSKLILNQINSKVGINTNNKALPVFFSTLKYLSRFYSNVYLLLGIPILLLFTLMLIFKKESRGMYIAGFTGASIEVLLIFVFQIAFGYIYSAIGMLIAIFMAGLALGAYFARKIPKSQKSYRISFLVLIIYLTILFTILSLPYAGINHFILWPVFIILMLIPSGLTGFIFVISTILFQPDPHQSAPAIYAVDLIGSSLGVIIMTIILIPLIGLSNACIFLIFLNIIPLAFSFPMKIR